MNAPPTDAAAGSKQARLLPLHRRWRRQVLARAGTSIGTELLAGLTTFGAMSYVIIVNPTIVSAAGPDFQSLVIMTALVSMIGTLIMALLADLPLALAPGMGANVVFAQTVVVRMGVPYRTALAMVLISGALFLVLAVTRWRGKIIRGFPRPVLIGMQASIGLFIAYLGMVNGGLVVETARGPHFGSVSDPAVLMAMVGVLVTLVAIAARLPGAFLFCIAAITIAGLVIHHPGGKPVTPMPTRFVDVPSLPVKLFLDFDFSDFAHRFFQLLPITLYLFISDFFGASSTMISILRRAGLEDEHGRIARERQAYGSDALGTVVGACLGSSTVVAYVESASGVEAGGRTGLTALFTAALFGLTLFLWPLMTVIPPEATAPVLIVVGILMLEVLHTLDTRTPETIMPALLMLIVAVVTTDLMMSLCLGCFAYTAIAAARRRWSALTPMLLGVDAALALYLLLAGSAV